jgi:hypothetical protein
MSLDARKGPPGFAKFVTTLRLALLKGILVVLSLVLTLAILEGVFYFLAPSDQSWTNRVGRYEGRPAEDPLFFEYHPIFGLDVKPNVHHNGVTTNSHGTRGPEYSVTKAPGVRRVLLIGDSQVWGYSLPDEYIIDAALRQLLGATPGHEPERVVHTGKVEVINFGVSGYAIDQTFLKFIVEGIELAPDLVALVVFPENDVIDTGNNRASNIEKPRFRLAGDELCVSNIPPSVASGWPELSVRDVVSRALGIEEPRVSILGWTVDFTRSSLVRYFKDRQLRAWVLNLNPERFSGTSAHTGAGSRRLRDYISCVDKTVPPPISDYDQGVRLVARLVVELHRAVRDAGASLLVLVKPLELDYRAGVPSEKYTMLVSALGSAAPLVDLFAVARERAIPADDLFMGYTHFSALGNRIIAEEIKRYFDGLYP